MRFGGNRISRPPGPYVTFHRPWRAGETVELVFEHALRLETHDRRVLEPASLPADTEALLFVGPWLMAADDATDPAFFAEPGPSENTVLLPLTLGAAETTGGAGRFADPGRRLRLKYVHGGFPGAHPLTLRPLSEATGHAPGTVATWLRYRSPR